MNALERTRAVLHREKPDQVPFTPYENLVPRGEFVRELRNRGMGLCTACTPTYWSEWPNVRFKSRTRGPIATTIWVTPVGSVSSWRRTHLRREVVGRATYEMSTIERNVLREGMIRSVEDYDPVIFVIEDEIFHEDHINYEHVVRDFREDCLVRIEGLSSPYDTSYSYFGERTPHGFANWVYAQQDYPHRFARLLEALQCREARRFRVIADSPGEVMYLRGLGGWFGPWYGPKQFREHALPFFQKYVPLLHEKGKILCLKADTTNLKPFKDLIPETGVDVVEGFTPPPIGDLSIEEARAAWGDEMVIWVNFPESIFLQGAESTKQYTLDLLRSDQSGRLIIGMTLMGMSMIGDGETFRVFKAGMRAIMDAIDESCR